MEQKTLLLIGPTGAGKSTTGCTLLRDPYAFTKGADMNRVTLGFESHYGNGLHVIDCPWQTWILNHSIFY